MTGPDINGADVEAARRLLESDGRFRVLNRVRLPPSRRAFGPVAGSSVGICVDTETTGLDAGTDAIIELAVRRFRFTPDGVVVAIDAPHGWLEDPGEPLDPVVSRLTGLVAGDLIGQAIDDVVACELLASASLVVAHHSRFDRPFIERRFPSLRDLDWSCSMEEVDWAAAGFEGRSLRWLLGQAGWFYDAHRAGDDVDALIELLRHRLPDGRTVLSHVAAASGRAGWLVRAVGAHFDRREVLKARGYFWHPGTKTWMREVADRDLEDERRWLADAVYAPGRWSRGVGPVVDRVDASSRYRPVH